MRLFLGETSVKKVENVYLVITTLGSMLAISKGFNINVLSYLLFLLHHSSSLFFLPTVSWVEHNNIGKNFILF